MAWRYFQGPPERPGIYRWPANGKSLPKQKLADVQVFRPDGSWRGNQREVLINQACSGLVQ